MASVVSTVGALNPSVTPQKQTGILMGSEREYDVSGVSGTSLPVLKEELRTKIRFHRSPSPIYRPRHILPYFLQRKAGGVEVSLDVSELKDLSEEGLRGRYDAQSSGSAWARPQA
jgi:splicing factor 3B subunit 2